MSFSDFFFLYTAIHLLLCAGIHICVRNRLLKFTEQLMPIVFLVPVAGVICAVIAEYYARNARAGMTGTMAEELYSDETDLRMKKLVPDEEEGIVIPLEEAMSINDSMTRRQLILNILRKSPEQYTGLLQKACTDEDIEVSHYASTAVMEIQRGYDYELQKSERLYHQDESNAGYRNEYINHLKDYIESELIDENVLFLYRQRLSGVLRAKIREKPEDMEAVVCASENYLALKNFAQAEKLAEAAVRKWPDCERPLLALLAVYEQTNNGEGIENIIRHVKDGNVYLSNHGKNVLAFWDKAAQTEEL